jgi:hypothetical protein
MLWRREQKWLGNGSLSSILSPMNTLAWLLATVPSTGQRRHEHRMKSVLVRHGPKELVLLFLLSMCNFILINNKYDGTVPLAATNMSNP